MYISRFLQGKHKPIYHPSHDCGDYVVVTNASCIKLTGTKLADKIYYHHTRYPGGLKKVYLKDLMVENPALVVRKAVRGMLPKDKFRFPRLDRLFIFNGEKHPYESNIYKNYCPSGNLSTIPIVPLRPIGLIHSSSSSSI